MALRRSKTAPELGGHRIFGDEDAAQLYHELDDLRHQFHELTERVNAQFTSIAAHAEIAREQVALAREEARADMERSRDTLIGLIERLREETVDGGLHAAGSSPGPSTIAMNERIESLEKAVADLTATVDNCMVRQQRMADTMSAFIDTLLADDRHEPVSGLSLA